MRILIKNGRLLDPGNNIDDVLDVLICGGRIEDIGRLIPCEADKVIDAEGLWVTPGLIDLHVHFREPGYEGKETIHHGGRSAAAGGFTTVCCMPNTNPVTDNAETVRYIIDKARNTSVNVLPVGAITMGQMGEKLSDMDGMADAGVCGFSEDGRSVKNALLMKQALQKAKDLGLPIFSHCEDLDIVNKGVVNLGAASERFALPGISCDSESVVVARDCILNEYGANLHICHVSAASSVAVIKAAKAAGIMVSAEVCPHHFSMCEDDIVSDDGNYKMNPPLRRAADVESIKMALKENIIDIIATDHAPHMDSEKNRGLRESAFGIVGLETAVGLCVTELVDGGVLTPLQLIDKLTVKPAKILGIDKGSLSKGGCADVTIIDPDLRYRVESATFLSKARNTPFVGRELKGRAVKTIVGGKIVYEYDRL